MNTQSFNYGVLNDVLNQMSMSQRKFAKICGISAASMSSYRHGKRVPSRKTAMKILEIVRGAGYELSLESLWQ